MSTSQTIRKVVFPAAGLGTRIPALQQMLAVFGDVEDPVRLGVR